MSASGFGKRQFPYASSSKQTHTRRPSQEGYFSSDGSGVANVQDLEIRRTPQFKAGTARSCPASTTVPSRPSCPEDTLRPPKHAGLLPEIASFHRPQPEQGSHVVDPYHNVLRSAGPRERGWLGLITLAASLLLGGHGWRGCLVPLTSPAQSWIFQPDLWEDSLPSG